MVEEEKKKGNKPLFKVTFGAIRATGWLNKSQKGEQFVSVDISRSFKKDRKSTRLNSSHTRLSRMPSSA